MTWMTTKSGIHFDFDNLTTDMIMWEDIVYSLSRINRFNGHTRGIPYTVAEHSYRVARHFKNKQLKLRALLHDAHEAYIGDITAPVKRLLGNDILFLSARIQDTIDKYFGLPIPTNEELHLIKVQDHSALLTEKRDLMPDDGKDWSDWCVSDAQEWPGKIIPIPSDAAYWMFKQELFNLWQP